MKIKRVVNGEELEFELTEEEIKEVYKQNNKYRELEAIEELFETEESCIGMCPSCGHKDFGDHTVLNSVDKTFQVPSLLKRLKVKEHDYILECSNCKKVYENGSNAILTSDEVDECNNIWEKEGEF